MTYTRLPSVRRRMPFGDFWLGSLQPQEGKPVPGYAVISCLFLFSLVLLECFCNQKNDTGMKPVCETGMETRPKNTMTAT